MAKPGTATNLWRGFFLLALLSWAFGPPARADQPPALESRAAEAQSTAANAQVTAQPGPIVLYTTSWCGYCRKTRALLTELGEPFEDKDIEKSAAAQKEYQAKGKGYTGIPLIDFDGTLIRGYNEPRLRSLVAERKRRAAEKAQPATAAE